MPVIEHSNSNNKTHVRVRMHTHTKQGTLFCCTLNISFLDQVETLVMRDSSLCIMCSFCYTRVFASSQT